jgi:hypothetical protein
MEIGLYDFEISQSPQKAHFEMTKGVKISKSPQKAHFEMTKGVKISQSPKKLISK